MTRRISMVAIVGLVFVVASCASRPWGTTLAMEKANRDDVFSAATVVMANYFSIKSADSKTGVIKSRPKPVQQGPGLLQDGGRPTRQVATISLVQDDGRTAATVLIEVQQEASGEYRQQPGAQRYSSIPNDTPAEGEAATTPEQNDAWVTIERDRKLEAKMLEELRRAL